MEVRGKVVHRRLVLCRLQWDKVVDCWNCHRKLLRESRWFRHCRAFLLQNHVGNSTAYFRWLLYVYHEEYLMQWAETSSEVL